VEDNSKQIDTTESQNKTDEARIAHEAKATVKATTFVDANIFDNQTQTSVEAKIDLQETKVMHEARAVDVDDQSDAITGLF
jgi:hypothetical protein